LEVKILKSSLFKAAKSLGMNHI